jgi:hypothetical protein
LSDCRLDNTRVTLLSHAFNANCRLKTLNLDNNDNINRKGQVELISRLGNLEHLTSLHLERVEIIFGDIFEALCEVVEKKITNLTVTASMLHLHYLSAAILKSKLKSLTLCRMDGEAIRQPLATFVETLGHCERLTLKSVEFRFFSFDSNSFQSSCSMLAPRLTRFIIRCGDLHVGSGEIIGQVLQNSQCQLEELGFPMCNLGNLGVCRLFPSLAMPTSCRLKKLNLRFNGITLVSGVVKALRSPHCYLTQLELEDNIDYNLVNVTWKCVYVARNLIVLKSAKDVARWGNKSSIAKLPGELCQLVGQMLVPLISN